MSEEEKISAAKHKWLNNIKHLEEQLSSVPFDDFINGTKNVPTPIVDLTSDDNNAIVHNSIAPMTIKPSVSVTAPTCFTDPKAAVSFPASLTTMTNPWKLLSPTTIMTSN